MNHSAEIEKILDPRKRCFFEECPMRAEFDTKIRAADTVNQSRNRVTAVWKWATGILMMIVLTGASSFFTRSGVTRTELDASITTVKELTDTKLSAINKRLDGIDSNQQRVMDKLDQIIDGHAARRQAK